MGYCRNCGNEVKENQAFCTKCGAKQGEILAKENETTPVCGRRTDKKCVNVVGRAANIFFLIICLVSVGITVYLLAEKNSMKETNFESKSLPETKQEKEEIILEEEKRQEDILENREEATRQEIDVQNDVEMYDVGFDTAEEAFDVYLSALKDHDLEKALSTFAVDKYLDNFNLKNYYEKIGYYAPNLNAPLPEDGAFTRDLNRYNRISGIEKDIYRSYLVLVGGEDILSQNVAMEGSTPEEFVDSLYLENESILDSFEYMEIMELSEYLKEGEGEISDEALARVAENTLHWCGGDELKYLVCRGNLTWVGDEVRVIFLMDTIRYGDKWYNFRILGGCAGTLGANVGITLDEIAYMY